jgi:hypothetical protein
VHLLTEESFCVGIIKNWREMSGTLEDGNVLEMEEHAIALDDLMMKRKESSATIVA